MPTMRFEVRRGSALTGSESLPAQAASRTPSAVVRSDTCGGGGEARRTATTTTRGATTATQVAEVTFEAAPQSPRACIARWQGLQFALAAAAELEEEEDEKDEEEN
mmetsp:Transcript_17293/g.44898  ORF Transcript_17293/g.44898 Transcript_17293/m.44898 type:complete len:106 (+) Transcript_17293:1567-1884(+)